MQLRLLHGWAVANAGKKPCSVSAFEIQASTCAAKHKHHGCMFDVRGNKVFPPPI
jgi:hypothetical protein